MGKGCIYCESIVRRVLTIFIIVDTSKSMHGKKMQAVNDSIREILPIIHNISNKNPETEIRIACLQFSTGATFMMDAPREAGDFEFIPMEAKGQTDMGAAISLLETKLHTQGKGWMNHASGSYAPIFILMSDGHPGDSYKRKLKQLKENKWFHFGVKIAIAIGNDAKRDILAEFTGDTDAVITVHSSKALRELIRLVTITSSTICSQSKHIDNTSTQSKVIAGIKSTQIFETIDWGVNAPQFEDDWK